jgi:hypothetical protein
MCNMPNFCATIRYFCGKAILCIDKGVKFWYNYNKQNALHYKCTQIKMLNTLTMYTLSEHNKKVLDNG